MATNPSDMPPAVTPPRLFTSPPRLRSVPPLDPPPSPSIPTSLFDFPDIAEEAEDVTPAPPAIVQSAAPTLKPPAPTAPAPQSPPNVVSLFHPRHFAPEFDLLEQLTHNRAAYTSPDTARWLSLRNLPVYVRIALERIRERVPGTPTPSLALTISCAASHGLSVIREHEAIIALLELYSQFQTSNGIDVQDLDELSTFFYKFHVGIVDGNGSGLSSQFNIRFPPHLREPTEDFSSRTGISMSVLVTLGTMVTLSTQPDDYVLPDHRVALDHAVETFFRRAIRRGRMAKTVIEMMGKG